MIKYCVVENASMGDYIYGKVVRIVDGAKGPVCEVDSGNVSFDLKDAIKPKNKA